MTMPDDPQRGARRLAWRAAGLYVAIGAAWIFTTDLLVDALLEGSAERVAGSIKGGLFVAGTGFAIYLGVRALGVGEARARGAERALKERTETLARSEERYRRLVELLPGVVWLNEVDRDDPKSTHCIYIAPHLEELLGYTPQEWMDDDDLWSRVIHVDDRPAVLLANQAADDSSVLSVEYRAIARDGRTVWIHDQAVRVPASDGGPVYWQGIMVDITAQRAADAGLQELGESFRGLFSASPVAIMAIEPDGLVRLWNPAAERMYGWNAGEVVGRPLPTLPPGAIDEHRDLLRRASEGEPLRGVELRRMRRDGTPVDVTLWTAPLLDATGAVEAVMCVMEDVTPRNRVERQQEALAGLGLLALEIDDLDELLAHATRLVADTLGVELVELREAQPERSMLLLRAGVGWGPGLVGSDTLPVETATPSTVALERGESVVAPDLGADDRFSSVPILRDHGAASAMAAIVHAGHAPYGVLSAFGTRPTAFGRDDVRFLQGIAAIVGLAIERSRAGAALQQAEARYRTLVEDGPAIVYLYDADRSPGHLTYISPQVEALLGYPRTDWMGDPLFWITVLHPADRDRVLRIDTSTIERGAPFDLEYRFVAADGRDVWIHDRSNAVRGNDGEILFRQGVMVDVTARRHAEDERRRAVDRQLRLATRLEILHELDRGLQQSRSIEEMSTLALDRLRRLIAFDRGSVGLLEGTDRVRLLTVRDDVGLGPAAGEMILIDPGFADLDIAGGVEVVDLRAPPPGYGFLAWAPERGLAGMMRIPMVLDHGVLGWVVLFASEPEVFSEDEQDVASEVASALAIAISQTRLRDDLRARADELERLAEERRQMLHRIVRAQEEERERVALELHDGLGQMLTSISLFVSNLRDEVNEEARGGVDRVSELVRRTIRDSRQIVWSLRPPELERLGLIPALRRLVEDGSGPDLALDLHEEIGGLRLVPEAEAVVYRVVQEAVNNAQKHAGATSVSILLHQTDGTLTALVEDDGRGFDPDGVGPGGGLGLIGMRERAQLVSGDLVVESAFGAGTRIRLEVPIDDGRPGPGGIGPDATLETA
jgi:PAS domain S-box-containing protein